MEPEVKLKGNIIRGIVEKVSLVIGELINNPEIQRNEASKEAEKIAKQETDRLRQLEQQTSSEPNSKGKKGQSFVDRAAISEEIAKQEAQKQSKKKEAEGKELL